MDNKPVRKVVIAGGGTAGWIAAAALSQQLGDLLEITLVESEEIGTIGVGESTIPPIRTFHRLLRIDEQEFMRATAATFKLGIHFENWARVGDHYLHPFGQHGKPTWLCDFHHFWLRSQEKGSTAEYGEYCVEWVAARAARFATSRDSEIHFAYHIDASLYGRFLRKFAEGRGVKRVEGRIQSVNLNPQSGFIESLTLQSDEVLEGDLFVDCTGFRGLLIEQALHSGFEDWSHWLPCDTAVAVQTETVRPAVPYTKAIAHEAGWRWQIPLQHRVGNGLVYCSRHLADEDAKNQLLAQLDGKPIRPPMTLKMRTGRRRKTWSKNCVALGLASGFVEPLESTSIHLVMTGVTRLLHLFPFDGVHQSFVDHYNELTRTEIEHVRDFIVLHYHANERDEPFWRYCREMQIPPSLAHRIELFKDGAHAWQGDSELFRVDSWAEVMLGQRIRPQHYHPAAAAISDSELTQLLNKVRESISRSVASLPSQNEFISHYCKASSDVWGDRPPQP